MRLIITSIIFVANIVYANPAHLGVEIGKATIEDVKKDIKLEKRVKLH